MELSVKQKIILATIECIEKEGINAVTIRSIGREAGVNSAAINYYFGSKDKLIEEVFEYIQKDLLMDFTEIIDSKEDLKAVIEKLLVYMLEGIIRYPNLVKAVFYEPFISNKYNNVLFTRLNVMYNSLYNKINELYPQAEKGKIKIAVSQLLASNIFSGLFPGIFNDFLGVDFMNEEAMKDHAKKAAEVFVNTISAI